jgi:hypothetical protein
LEADIEEDLENEIIDNMCRLARHLQRLYQHRHGRQHMGSAATDRRFSTPHPENAVLWEMNIRIKLDAQCRIDITKIENDATTIQPNPCPSTDHSNNRSLKIRQCDAIHCRKQHHPVLPWR